ncbi:MAG: alkane 1-monooxygenase [Rhodobacteraceae bacterium]|nr:alkane 1-monooxygenase [Paracoccaceae bacterium]
MTRFISQFTALTVIPAILLIDGAMLGGWWPALAVFYLTVFRHLADRLMVGGAPSPSEPWLKTVLPVSLALLHFMLLAAAVWSLAFRPDDLIVKVLIFIGFGLYFATVSNANGHELIHRTGRFEHVLGKWIFISMLFGHHTSAHLLVHHPYVATPFDPNSAGLNEGFYRFWRRAWTGSFLMGLRAENVRRGKTGGADPLSHPYIHYVFGGFAFIIFAYAFCGVVGVVWYFGLCATAQMGLLLTDYMQHYGLRRTEFDDGRYEAVGLHHSWNAPQWFTRHLTLNATRHSDHHAKPARPYTELQFHPVEIAPELPRPAGTMAMIALVPALWRRVMNPRLNALQQRENAKTELSNSA